MKKIILIIIGMVLSLSVFAESKYARINGIWFRIDTENHVAVVIPMSAIKGATFTDPYDKKMSQLVIPNTVPYYPSVLKKEYYECPVIGIEAHFFADNTYIKDVILPKSITFIGDSAFAGCKSLKSIEIPASVTEIGEYAFANCKKLRYVRFNSSLGAKAGNKTWFVGTKASVESVLMPGESVSIP